MSATAYLTSIYKDETLYSWCGAQHQFGNEKSEAKTAFVLLGHYHGIRQHDIPVGLSRLPLFDQSTTQNSFLAALKNHTIGGYYWPFLDALKREKVVSNLSDVNNVFWKRTLLRVSRTKPVTHPLKWCPQCVLDDEMNCGRAYWHVAHQSPITTACHKHSVQLHIAKKASKRWTLPGDDGREIKQTFHIDIAAATLNQAIPKINFVDTDSLRLSALLRLRELGVIISLNGVSHDRLLNWFGGTGVAKWCAGDSGLRVFSNGSWLPNLLWRRRDSHPLCWPILWLALDWESSNIATMSFVDSANGLRQDSDHQLLLEFTLQNSLYKAPAKTYEAFLSSSTYAEVMEKLNTSRADVTRWLEWDPSLRNAWRSHLRAQKQDLCEQMIHSVAASLEPDISISKMELLCFNELRWMQKHAPQKLQVMLKSVAKRLSDQPTLFDAAVSRP